MIKAYIYTLSIMIVTIMYSITGSVVIQVASLSRMGAGAIPFPSTEVCLLALAKKSGNLLQRKTSDCFFTDSLEANDADPLARHRREPGIVRVP